MLVVGLLWFVLMEFIRGTIKRPSEIAFWLTFIGPIGTIIFRKYVLSAKRVNWAGIARFSPSINGLLARFGPAFQGPWFV